MGYNQKICAEVAKYISDIEPGTFLSHAWLCEKLGCEDRRSPYGTRIRLMHSILIEDYQLFLDSLPGKGYRIAEHGKAIDTVEGRASRFFHAGSVWINRASKIPIEKIENENERNRTLDRLQRMQTIRLMLAKGNLPALKA